MGDLSKDPAAPTVEELAVEECLALLAGERVGRLAVDNQGQPEIFPVSFALDEDRIVIRSGEGTKLRNASLDRVAFEVDRIDQTRGEAWSVVVKGTAREISTALDAASERQRQLPLEAFVQGDRLHWLRIVPREISGRRIRRAGG